jgi:hypothetical protein
VPWFLTLAIGLLSTHKTAEKQAVSSDSFGKYSISVSEIFMFSLEK